MARRSGGDHNRPVAIERDSGMGLTDTVGVQEVGVTRPDLAEGAKANVEADSRIAKALTNGQALECEGGVCGHSGFGLRVETVRWWGG